MAKNSIQFFFILRLCWQSLFLYRKSAGKRTK